MAGKILTRVISVEIRRGFSKFRVKCKKGAVDCNPELIEMDEMYK